eukprot:ctg_2150.g426
MLSDDVREMLRGMRRGGDAAATLGCIEEVLVGEAAISHPEAFTPDVLDALIEALPAPHAMRILRALGRQVVGQLSERADDALDAGLVRSALGQSVTDGASDPQHRIQSVKLATRTLASIRGADADARCWSRLVPQLASRIEVTAAFGPMRFADERDAALALVALAKLARHAPLTLPPHVWHAALERCDALLSRRIDGDDALLRVAGILCAANMIVAEGAPWSRSAATTDSNNNNNNNNPVDMPEAVVDSILNALLTLVQRQGDWSGELTDGRDGADANMDVAFDDEACARLRYYAGKALLKMARVSAVDRALLPQESHLICFLMQDPIFEIRRDFARKVFHGVTRGGLSFRWSAISARTGTAATTSGAGDGTQCDCCGSLSRIDADCISRRHLRAVHPPLRAVARMRVALRAAPDRAPSRLFAGCPEPVCRRAALPLAVPRCDAAGRTGARRSAVADSAGGCRQPRTAAASAIRGVGGGHAIALHDDAVPATPLLDPVVVHRSRCRCRCPLHRPHYDRAGARPGAAVHRGAETETGAPPVGVRRVHPDPVRCLIPYAGYRVGDDEIGDDRAAAEEEMARPGYGLGIDVGAENVQRSGEHRSLPVQRHLFDDIPAANTHLNSREECRSFGRGREAFRHDGVHEQVRVLR